MKKVVYTRVFKNIFLTTITLIAFYLLLLEASATNDYDFANFTEEDSMSFVEQCNIEIPEEFLQMDGFSSFTKNLIHHSYSHPNESFCFNYAATQKYAEEIRAAVNSYLNVNLTYDVAPASYYSLRYNTVMDENGNWVTSGGYYDEKWLNYNCYAYSLNRVEQPQFYYSGELAQYQPGNMSNDGSFADTSSITELAELVKKDLMAMGYSNIFLSSTIPTIDSTQELICVRRHGSIDYHFMRYDIETNAWYHKPGNKAVLKYNFVPSNELIWYSEYSCENGEHPSLIYYESDIVFICYSKNQINIATEATTRKYINPTKDIFCELDFVSSGKYGLMLESTHSIQYEIYDKDFDIIILGSGAVNYISTSIASGKYYLRINFESCTDLNYVNISIHTHTYNHCYESDSITQHKAYCWCGEYEYKQHTFFDDACVCCGLAHIHEYIEWEYYSNTQHIEKCTCGCLGTVRASHVVRSNSVGIFKPCVYCGALINTGSDFSQIESTKILITESGSYIMPNGIIVLVDADIEAYLNGELVFYDPYDNLETS